MKNLFNQIYRPNTLEFTPRIDQLVFHNEADIFPGQLLENKLEKIETILDEKEKYKWFLKQKGRRPTYDIYACFQPFNEATKAVFPFLKKLQQTIKKDDVILSLWDRAGWQTNLLAALFPEQHIIATWEGNKDVLGYKGFHFWMQQQKNITVLFCDLNAPIPLKDDSIAFSVGYDVFHNFNQALLIEELFRVVKNDGAILFPHVHLTNSEPKPFFERGCKQMHGTDYQKAFDHLAKVSNWQGLVFSEPSLFSANDIDRSENIPVFSNPNSTDYNALIALLPKSWKGASLSAYSLKDISNIEDSRILINLLLDINLHQQQVSINHQHMDGSVDYLLERHPVYVERIKKLNHFPISELTCKIIYLAKKGFTIKEICEHLYLTKNQIIQLLDRLEQFGLLQVLPLSDTGFRLQSYLMSQHYLFTKSEQNLKSLWYDVVKSFPQNLALISQEDSSEFTYEDCNEIISSIILALHKSGLKKGDKIIVCSKLHTESILLFWACMQIGVILVPIGTHLPKDTINYIQQLTNAKLLFLNESSYKAKAHFFKEISTIVFDQGENELDCFYFTDWLATIDGSEIQQEEKVDIFDTDEAVILFTSGSTGLAKGVLLSHGNLFRSGRLISETFFWEKEDRFFGLGGLESMSGLRNSTISALHVGASVVVPKELPMHNLFGISEAIAESSASILGANPSFFRQVVKFSDRIREQLDSLRTVICTGNKLSEALRSDFKEKYNLSILNYYGLTETTGICISQSPSDQVIDKETIGTPVNCIAQIVDEKGEILPIGEEGELRIFSDNLMQGYYKNPDLTKEAIKDGWFYTKDIARYQPDGCIKLLGRKRNIIKTTTEEVVYLEEIQQYINHLNIVEEAVICPYSEEDSEKLVAFIVLKEDISGDHIIKKNIRQLLLSGLGELKVPNQIHFVKQLPYTDNGKLITKELFDVLQ